MNVKVFAGSVFSYCFMASGLKLICFLSVGTLPTEISHYPINCTSRCIYRRIYTRGSYLSTKVHSHVILDNKKVETIHTSVNRFVDDQYTLMKY